MSGKELTLQDLLEIENDVSIASVRCDVTGVPLWPQIRVRFFRMLMSDLLYETTLTGVPNSTPSGRKALAFMSRALLRNLRWRMSQRRRTEVFILTDAIADQWKDGKWFNRLSDHFALCRPDATLTIEDQFEWRWPFPRHNPRLLFHSPIQAGNALVGRFRVTARHERMATALVQLVCERAKRLYAWTPGAQREQELVTALAHKAASTPWQYQRYESMLKRVAPRLLMVSAACYGAGAATFMAVANDAGIATGEFQHGASGGGHDAYNFAPAIRDSETYRRTLPRYFLAYGEWWGEQMNVPVTKVVIGNPHRDEMLARVPPRSESKHDILILSDGTEFAKYLQLAQEIVTIAAKQGLRVVLRPHPLERTIVAATYGERIGAVVVDSNADLYVSLRGAHAVISEVSTGLFEAAGLADKLFLWDTPKARFGYPQHPFQSFANSAALLELLARNGSGQLTVASHEAIWAASWRDNYLRFLDTALAAGGARHAAC